MTVAVAIKTRFHPRVEVGLMVRLMMKGKAYSVRATDLSMAGLCLQGDLEGLEDTVTLSIPLTEERCLVTEAKVRRRLPGKVGFEFAQLDWEDMFALARFLHPRLP